MEREKAPKVNLAAFKISREVLRTVPAELLLKHLVVPFDLQDGRLSLAMDDPEDASVVDKVRLVCGYECDLFHAPKESILDCLKLCLPELAAAGHVKEFQIEEGPAGRDGLPREVDIVKAADKLFEMAVSQGASDIHIEPQEHNVFVRFRIDGILTTIHKFPKSVQAPVTARIKVLSNMDITEKRLPQDGQFSGVVMEKNIDFRVSTLPGKYGEKVVIRVLDKSSFALELSQLGFEPTVQSMFETLIQKPQGLLLVTGPTGSGKTTTLYSVLNRLRSPLKNVITLEDPIEYELLAGRSNESGITQVQINPKIGMTFAAGLRSSLRQDPDIIMVGEVRDKETAEIAMKASLTGHLVLSTLHTNDALGTLLRLRDMGIESYLITSTVIGVLAQRLVRVICPACREPYRVPQKALKHLFPGAENQSKEAALYRAKGCEKCHFTGYHGRMGIFELLVMTEDLKQLIHSKSSLDGSEDAVCRAVLKTLRESGLDLVRQGVTTVEEVFRTTAE
ncbi:MAG: hypothetical protein A2902_03510 [Elusimicrobia bacterium RIFCSPLOWO2_01_FULL_64_13]|nr:MAG: hypothetical protein A2902_03510 [Elusimicrobia bacterium RIFCSPLOWO2_01_FULL_64_13]